MLAPQPIPQPRRVTTTLAARTSTPVSPRSVAIAALLTGAIVGVALAVQIPAGLAALLAAGYIPLVLFDIRLALVLWAPLIFFEGIPALNYAGKAAGVLLIVAWIGALRAERDTIVAVLRRHVRLLALAGLLLVWLTLTLGWASSASAGASDLWHWYAVFLLFVIAATVSASRDGARALAWAFVVGAILSVLIAAIASNLVQTPVNPITGSSADGPRLAGTQGDPNFFAAGLIPAAFIAAGLIPGTRSRLARTILVLAIGVMVAGIVASQSRGGAIAALVVVVASFAFFRRRRGWVLAFVLLTTGICAAWFVAAPSALHRLTTLSSGNGRTDEWTVASRVFADHPFGGAGLNNFRVVAGQYVRRPGTVTHAQLLVDSPHFVHNVYLQFLAETGIVGLLLFLAFVLGALRAMWLAARSFEASGDQAMGALAQATLVGAIGMLAASTFISDGEYQVLWLLLALGPALVAAAGAAVRAKAPSPAANVSAVPPLPVVPEPS